jgi:hypothetical protein
MPTAQFCRVATKTGDATAPAHWVGQWVALTPPCDSARRFPVCRGQWVITHRASGLSAGTLLCSKRRAAEIARQWDRRFALIDPADARAWPFARQWADRVASINAPWREPAPAADDSTETACELAARAGLPIDQAGGVRRIWWRGKFWPAPSDAELEFWALDSCCETPDGRTVEPDAPDSWLAILRLI